MADYYSLISRAVAALDKNISENRRAIYERARTGLLAPLGESDITRERLALEESIRKVEAESARQFVEATRQALPQERRIFICYRREDSAAYAGRIKDRLDREFGADFLFMDVDAIPLGKNFVKILQEEVAKCSALLAVIGPGWLDVRDENGNRRLDDPNDFVRIEIAAALQRDVSVIPILLDGARIPKAHQLPKELGELTLRGALDVRHVSFHSDMDKLVRALKP